MAELQSESLTDPKRVQRWRTRGWRTPPGAVYVGRPTRWGNPLRVGDWVSVGPAWRGGGILTVSTVLRDTSEVVSYYRMGLRYGGLTCGPEKTPVGLPSVADIRAELAGRDLMCWCGLDRPCHADVLLKVANHREDHPPQVAHDGELLPALLDVLDEAWSTANALERPAVVEDGTVDWCAVGDAVEALRHLTRCVCESPYPLESGRHDTRCAQEYRDDVEALVAVLDVLSPRGVALGAA